MSEPKITWNNLHEATQHELRQSCKIGYGRVADRKLEVAVRKHLDGANMTERRSFYQQFYGRRK